MGVMVKFHGRTVLLQFMKNKPARFGLKWWGICTADGFLLDCDIYCGKGSTIYSANQEEKLSKCCLGSRVVMLMLQGLLSSVSLRKILLYHLYCDNFFTNPDLFVHLAKLGLKATGTVRKNRIKEVNELDNKAERGTYTVKHETNSGMNYITVMDSKQVSLLSTAAGITPESTVMRFSAKERKKVNLQFPHAFKVYNNFMGGVDQHDEHCSNLMPCIRAKKWTWVVLMRLIQSSITNATVLRNLAHEGNKVGTKEISMEIANFFLSKGALNRTGLHQSVTSNLKRNCCNFAQCATRTCKMCQNCNMYVCSACYPVHVTK